MGPKGAVGGKGTTALKNLPLVIGPSSLKILPFIFPFFFSAIYSPFNVLVCLFCLSSFIHLFIYVFLYAFVYMFV